jgi:hypothetical protein
MDEDGQGGGDNTVLLIEFARGEARAHPGESVGVGAEEAKGDGHRRAL